MGLLGQMVAGGVEGAAHSVSETIDNANKFDAMAQLEQWKAKQNENIARLNNQFQTERDTTQYNRQDVGVNDSGVGVSRADAANGAPVTNAKVWEAGAGERAQYANRPVAQDTSTGKFFFPGDDIPSGDNIHNLSADQAAVAQAQLAKLKADANESNAKAYAFSQGYRGSRGSLDPSARYQQFLDMGMSPEDARSAAANGHTAGGANVPTVSTALQTKWTNMANDIADAYNSGNTAKGADTLALLNQELAAHKQPLQTYKIDTAPTPARSGLLGLGSKDVKDGTGHFAPFQSGANTGSASPAPGNAKQGKDGNWYVPDPNRAGKYLMYQP